MNLHRYSTSLSEIQAAVSQLRQWIDQGIAADNLAVVAPNIEQLWPTLYEYCDREGLSCDKAVVTKAVLAPEIQTLLAELKLRLGRVDRPVLEQMAYADSPLLPYSEFSQKFSNFYGLHQVEAEPRLKTVLDVPKLSEEPVRFSVFLDTVFAIFKGDAAKWLVPSVERAMSEVREELELPAEKWVEYFERILAKTEITIKESDPQGLKVLSLGAADWISAEYVWMMGLTEESLKSFEPMGLTIGEVLSLSQQAGFQLSLPDQRHNEFEAMWLMESQFEDLHLSTAATDFSGQAQAASLLWLERSLKQGYSPEAIEMPAPTRMRELQIAQCTEPRSPEPQISPLNGQWPEKLRLSATQIEKYLDCPFVFAAQKLLHLKDEPALDLDMDAMAKGQFQHALFEALTEEPLRWDWTETELKELLQKLKVSHGIRMGEKALWPAFERRYLKMAERFLEFEKNWRARFPKTKILARELEIRAHWNIEQKKFVTTGEGIPFYGRIDRVDGQLGSGQVILLDYKSSSANLRHWQKWLESRELQMALYALAVEDGVTSLGPSEVVGAFYFVLREQERHKGFRLESARDQELFPSADRIRNWMKPEEKAALFEGLRNQVNDVITRMKAGDFAPVPQDVKMCPDCRWRVLCRAPHLN